jgi:hypothetical protein
MKRNLVVLTCLIAAFALFAGNQKESTSSSSSLITQTSGSGAVNMSGGSTSCCGSYSGFANITNDATGTVWFSPPSGTTNCVATDSSGLPSPYVSCIKAIRKGDLVSWCGTSSVSFPATSNREYKFIIYVKNTPPPPSDGDILTLDIQWQK